MKKTIACIMIAAVVLGVFYCWQSSRGGDHRQEYMAVLVLSDSTAHRGRIVALCDSKIVIEQDDGPRVFRSADIEQMHFESRKRSGEFVDFTPGPALRQGWHIMGFDLQGTRHYPYPSAALSEGWRLRELFSHPGFCARTGDITGDGVLELVVNSGRGIMVYNGAGDTLFRVNIGREIADAFILGDVSGNGILDVVVGRYQRGEVYSARAYNFDGHTIAAYSRSGGARDSSLTPFAVADLSGDGGPELAAFAGSGYPVGFRGLVVFDAKTRQEIGAYEQGPHPSAYRRSSLSIADFTGDGRMEIVHGGRGPANSKTANETADNEAWLFVHNHDASIRWQNRFDIGRGFRNADAVLYDFFGDGSPLIAAATYNHGWDAWDGNIGLICMIDPVSGKMLEGYFRNLESTCRIEAVADLDGSGTAQIVLSRIDGRTRSCSLLAVKVAPSMPVASEFSVQGEIIRVGAVVDFNGDGEPNVIAFADCNVYILNGALEVIAGVENASAVRDLIVSDITGDGRNEIILWDRSHVRVYGAAPR